MELFLLKKVRGIPNTLFSSYLRLEILSVFNPLTLLRGLKELFRDKIF